MYRPLSQNEYAIVSKTIYDERGLEGGLAESMFMAYKARAMALDEPEYVIFQETETERKARLAEKQKEKVTELKTGAELAPMDFLRKLEAVFSSDEPSKEPKDRYEWFFGDETKLDSRFKRLRLKFFNSPKYRKLMLQRYIDYGILTESQIDDFQLVGRIIGEFHRKYPGTRQGIISYYERLFGDSSGFSFDMVVERENFFTDVEFRRELLKKLKLPEDMSIDAVREDLRKSAIESGVLTEEEIKCWEEKSP
jgi:hypothetical protein